MDHVLEFVCQRAQIISGTNVGVVGVDVKHLHLVRIGAHFYRVLVGTPIVGSHAGADAASVQNAQVRVSINTGIPFAAKKGPICRVDATLKGIGRSFKPGLIDFHALFNPHVEVVRFVAQFGVDEKCLLTIVVENFEGPQRADGKIGRAIVDHGRHIGAHAVQANGKAAHIADRYLTVSQHRLARVIVRQHGFAN